MKPFQCIETKQHDQLNVIKNILCSLSATVFILGFLEHVGMAKIVA